VALRCRSLSFGQRPRHTRFLKEWVNNIEEYRSSLERFTLEFWSRTCGLSEDDLKRVAHTDRRIKRCLHSLGDGRDASTARLRHVDCYLHLLLVSGNYMRPGTGAYPLRGHNNVQGASDHGSMPNLLPGYQPVDDPNVRSRFEAPGTSRCILQGLDNHEMVDAIHEGKLKAMYLIGEEMSLVDSNANYVSAGFSKLEFFVVQDIFFSETCKYADVVLPASPSLEKEGTLHQHRTACAAALPGSGNHSQAAGRTGRSFNR